MSFVRHSPDLLPRDTDPHEIGAGRNAAVYPRNKMDLGEISEILRDYEDAGKCQRNRGIPRISVVSIFVENVDIETMMKLENSPDVALAYYTRSDSMPKLKPVDLNFIGAGGAALIYTRDSKKLGEIPEIIKDYEAAGKVTMSQTDIRGETWTWYISVRDMDLDTLVKLQNCPDVSSAFYASKAAVIMGPSVHKVADELKRSRRREYRKKTEDGVTVSKPGEEISGGTASEASSDATSFSGLKELGSS